MAIFSRDEKIKQEIEAVSSTDTEAKEVITTEEAYNRSVSFRKKLYALGLATLLIFELGVAGGFSYEIYKDNLYGRVLREYEIRHTGGIRLTTGTYTGETDFGYFFGTGTFEFDAGGAYKGSWNNNLLSGHGELRVPSEGSYDGEFIASQKSGNGIFTWDDGSVYDGGWKNDMMSGQGMYTGSDGVIYSGTFYENAFYEGKCTFTNETGSYVLSYKGGAVDNAVIEFSDGTRYIGGADENSLNGSGKMTFANDDVYNGSFVNGIRNGTGIYTWASGDKYDGAWENDMLSGTGTYTFTDGSVLQGTFSNNKFSDGSYHVVNDFGDYTFTIEAGKPVAVDMKLASGTEYIGDLDDDGLNGHAQIKYDNGDRYDGKVSDGMKSGQGTYSWVSGASYDGPWADDQMSGRGTYTYPASEEGYKLVGNFVAGLPDGECEYYTSAYTHYKTTWTNGKCTKVTE